MATRSHVKKRKSDAQAEEAILSSPKPKKRKNVRASDTSGVFENGGNSLVEEQQVNPEKATSAQKRASSKTDGSDHEQIPMSKALMKGFESSDDDDGSSVHEDDVIKEIPSAPADAIQKSRAKRKKDSGSTGVIYVGRVPHGFYEHQMRAYFSQFGDITRLRLSRNRKTGKSKHYAFIEFKSSEVAQIVADTMDKYLMFGHILQVSMIPDDQVHPSLFKGANKRYNVIPRNMLERKKLELGTDQEGWEHRVQTEVKRRESKSEKLRLLGYEYHAPQLKSTKSTTD